VARARAGAATTEEVEAAEEEEAEEAAEEEEEEGAMTTAISVASSACICWIRSARAAFWTCVSECRHMSIRAS
jgi:hypothetical protein